MKKITAIFICSIVAVSLCACAAVEPLTASTEAQMTETPVQITETQAQPTESAETKLSEVLSGEGTFYSHSYEKDLTIDEYCAAFGEETGVSVAITKCTAVDLEQDNVPEIVLWIVVNEYNDYGTVVLRYQNGEVEEYTFAYRQLFDLKQDGTFSCSGSELDGIASLTFHDGNWEYKEITGQQQDAKESAAWFSYPREDYSELFNHGTQE